MNIKDNNEKCINTINELFDKYKNNTYMLQRINNHIVNYLPNTLEHELSNYESRIIRNNYLSSNQQIFIQVFLSKNKYFKFYLTKNGNQKPVKKETETI